MDRSKIQITSTLVAAILIMLAGMTFYHFQEGLSWNDSWYFIIITLSTVGYGDISPVTPVGKFMTTIFILIGLGIMGSLITGMGQFFQERRERKLEKRYGTSTEGFTDTIKDKGKNNK